MHFDVIRTHKFDECHFFAVAVSEGMRIATMVSHILTNFPAVKSEMSELNFIGNIINLKQSNKISLSSIQKMNVFTAQQKIISDFIHESKIAAPTA